RPARARSRFPVTAPAATLAGGSSLELARSDPGVGIAKGLSPAEPLHLLVYLGVLLRVHVAPAFTGRRTDQVLLPAVGLLGGISLLLMERLTQDLVVQHV